MNIRSQGVIDRTFFILTVILIGLGFVILYSASSSIAAAKFNDPGYYMRGHLFRIIAGLIVGAFFLFMDYQKLKSIAFWLVVLSIILLVLTLIYNKIQRPHSTARWIPLGFFNAQPSEFAKLALIVYLASFLDRQRSKLQNFKSGFLPPIATMFIVVFLIVIEPDFSTGAIIALLGFLLLSLGGTKPIYLLSLFTLIGPISVIHILQSPYKIKRIITFFDLGKDPQGAGYQINQSLITLGNGGFWGRGLAGSVEKNLFLPDPHTDFVFSVVGEEFGFIGCALLLTLFLILFIKGIKISLHAPDIFGNLLGVGLSCSIFIYVLINIGVVCGLLPVTGLPLPFLSYGGSAMIFNLTSVGILLNISKHSIPKKRTQTIVTINA